MYNPTSGRWLSEDPMGLAAGDTNLHRYVGNNTTGATDPSGNVSTDIKQMATSAFEEQEGASIDPGIIDHDIVDGSNDRRIVERGWDQGDFEDALDKELERDIDPGFSDPTLVDGSNDRGFFRGGVDQTNDQGWRSNEKDTSNDRGFGVGPKYTPDPRNIRHDGSMLYVKTSASSLTSLPKKSGTHEKAFLDLITQISNEIEDDIKNNKFKPNTQNPGWFGREIHNRMSNQIHTLPNPNQFYSSVVVENGTNKIISIGNGPGVAGTTEIDVVLMQKNHKPLKVGDTLDHTKIKDLYDVKTSIDGTMSESQKNRYKYVKSGWQGWHKDPAKCLPPQNTTIKVIHTEKRGNLQGRVVKNPNYTQGFRVIKLLSIFGTIVALSEGAAYAASPEFTQASRELAELQAKIQNNKLYPEFKGLDNATLIIKVAEIMDNLALPPEVKLPLYKKIVDALTQS
jgi:hypothetical protein